MHRFDGHVLSFLSSYLPRKRGKLDLQLWFLYHSYLVALSSLRVVPRLRAVAAAVIILNFPIAARAASFVSNSPMGSPRAGHSATVLANGKVLVTAGGLNNSYALTSELYHPATKAWTPTGAMNSPSRSSFTATLLANGKVLVVGGASGTYPYAVLSSAELYDPASGAWTNTGAMKTPRYGHTATLLSNGKVLVSGGDTDGSSIVTTATAELYDPATGLWTFAGAMSTPRYLSVATALPDGKVLVIGGDNETNGYLSSAELYDPSADSWSGAGTMTTLRQSPMATALLDGKVLVTGGYNGSYLASSELYNPADRTWTATAGGMSVARLEATVTLLPGGKVLVAGGYSGTGPTSSSAELYDPATGEWTPTGPLKTGRSSQAAVFLLSGQVLATGGTNFDGNMTVTTLASTELYDPANGSWSLTTPLDLVRQLHTATLLRDGKVLLSGGLTNTTPTTLTSATTRIYDPVAASWTDSGAMTTKRVYHTATGLPDGTVFVAGGSADGSGSALASTEMYNGAWTMGPALAAARMNHAAALLSDGRVLLAGGFGVGGRLASAEVCNPAGTCGSVGSMTSARQYPAATTMSDGRVLISGGYFNGPLNSVEIYNPNTAAWTAAAPMAFARYLHTSTLLPNGKVMVVGGYGSSGELTSCEIYDPVANQWTATGSLATARYYHSTTLLPNGNMLVAGGANFTINQILSSAELYKPNSGTWTVIDSMHSIRYGHTASLLNNGKVFVAGGANLSNVALAGAELFDPNTATWSSGISLSRTSGFQWSFSAPPGAGYSILASSDITLPVASWTRLFSVFEISPGQFRFVDPQVTGIPQRFYRLDLSGSGGAPASFSPFAKSVRRRGARGVIPLRN